MQEGHSILEALDSERHFAWATSLDQMNVQGWRVLYFEPDFIEDTYTRMVFFLGLVSIRREVVAQKNKSSILFVKLHPTSLWVYYGGVKKNVESFLLKRELGE